MTKTTKDNITLSHELNERVKELRCLYGISSSGNVPSLSATEFIHSVLEIIPPGWQYPESTCACITLNNQKYKSTNAPLEETPWVQSAEIVVFGEIYGKVDIHYLKEYPILDEGPFLNEERHLITGIAELLSQIIERKQMESQLKQSVAEKEELLKEIHHRVKNNLQIISAIVLMHTQQADDEKSQKFFQGFQNRIKAMSQIHEDFMSTNNSQNIEMDQYIHRIIGNLNRTYGYPGREITLLEDIDPIQMQFSKAIHIGLVINELVSNAFKYAFEGKNSGEISVKFKDIIRTNELILEITDNGIGFQKEVNIDIPESLGMEIIDISTKQLKGNWCYIDTKGTCCRIVFDRNQLMEDDGKIATKISSNKGDT